ncbi:hypothetical protein BDZ91DRAFT_699495 [Kalaharituber pfeilii]|nr:hypothetical protein BDZ91DRAFT_699495 [Kalaharituber pfeilii]
MEHAEYASSTALGLSVPESDGAGHKWLLTGEELAHIAEMLNVDSSTIIIQGNIMNRERDACKSCGKFSGLDDLVHNALARGIHTPKFIVDVLQNGPKNNSPGHEIQCSKCGEMFDGSFSWRAFGDWLF